VVVALAVGGWTKGIGRPRRLEHVWPQECERERKKIKVVAWSPFYLTRRGMNGEEGGGGPTL
jgi:hypothetical protein